MNIKEKNITIQGEYAIGATITYENEQKKSPAVVIIMGTGQLDRDGNGFGFKSNIYKELAQTFAEFGYVSARYDKRGTHASGGNFIRTGLSDLVNDAISVIQYLKKQPYVDADRILVLDNGRVSAYDNHANLMKTSRLYQDIYASQLKDADTEAGKGGAL